MPNRLVRESSPYLLQHAHNPVDWYAWGADAFEAARVADKPIFLSVGYSTCYWCHVMERQCFENHNIAMLMNQHFINIKVDREERPDVDALYMQAVQVLTRQGGWPMSVFLAPDLKPFYGGTYFPPTDAYGRPGFPTLLAALAEAYRDRKSEIARTTSQLLDILDQLAEPAAPRSAVRIDHAFVESIVDSAVSDYDPAHGGFGGAPKFPRQTLLELILVHHRYFPNERRQQMVLHTLDALANGGIRDHLGGGFHRYSTDAHWLVPHFEIMLYDNAMLAWVYIEAYRQTEEPRYARIARGILDFVLREMTSPDGAFYTALDAEVDGQEGQNYLWTAKEIYRLLGPDGTLLAEVYGIDRGPNFADPHHGNGEPDKNILFLPNSLESVAAKHGTTVDALDATLKPLRETLYAARQKRKQPLLDTKIITSWNALMIRALAYAGNVLQEPRYLQAGERAAAYLLKHHRTPQADRLYRTSRDGVAKTNGFLDDYAFLTQALIALHDGGADEKWKDEARALGAVMNQRFFDADHGGYFFTDASASELIIRQKIGTDSPLPSGSAIAAMAMLTLGHGEHTQRTLAAFAQPMRDNGEGMSALVEAATFYLQQNEAFTVSATNAAADEQDRPLTPQQIAASVVTITGSWTSPSELRLQLAILRGFHINAHAAAEGLIATSVSVVDAADTAAGIDYPPGEERRFAFADKPVSVYDGTVQIAVRFKSPMPSGTMRIAVSYQACDDQACFPAVTKTLEIATP